LNSALALDDDLVFELFGRGQLLHPMLPRGLVFTAHRLWYHSLGSYLRLIDFGITHDDLVFELFGRGQLVHPMLPRVSD